MRCADARGLFDCRECYAFGSMAEIQQRLSYRLERTRRLSDKSTAEDADPLSPDVLRRAERHRGGIARGDSGEIQGRSDLGPGSRRLLKGANKTPGPLAR